MKRFFNLMILLSLGVAAFAQQPSRPPAEKAKSSSRSITGRVVIEGGQAVADAAVLALPVNIMGNQSATVASILRPITTDEAGRFEIKDLSSGAYSIHVLLVGYVTSDNREQKYYRPGDAVTISLIKGAVITGRVTNFAGDPIVGARIRAIRVKDGEGRAVRADAPGNNSISGFVEQIMNVEWQTDDRGVYRVYGLEPGSYHVSAGGKGLLSFLSSGTGGYDSDAPTYYPSGTIDTAAEVKVGAGEEATGIDIRYRENRGYTVSGTVTGQIASETATSIMLIRAATGALEGVAIAQPNSSNHGFMLTSVSEGDYYINAVTGNALEGTSTGASASRRISVRGADVTGIELALLPLGSVSGRVTVEPAPGADSRAECKPARPASVEEIALMAQSDRKDRPKDEPDLLASNATSTPNAKGEFLIRFLEQGQKRMVLKLPGEQWYARAITLQASAASRTLDLARDGFSLKPGESLNGVNIILKEGAASLSGRVVTGKEESIPATRLRIHLVPAEALSADETLRYAETTAQSDGTFKFANLAPGRYWIVVRQMAEEESIESPSRPVAWDANGRAGLRFEGEAVGSSIELKPCQKIADFLPRYTPPVKPTTKRSN
ncbi:MAG TPA: hypothetical protein VID27_09735 [Blastocatellia bacterium]